jgi:hypothetical protein
LRRRTAKITKIEPGPLLQNELAEQQPKQSKGAGHYHQQDEHHNDDQPSN